MWAEVSSSAPNPHSKSRGRKSIDLPAPGSLKNTRPLTHKIKLRRAESRFRTATVNVFFDIDTPFSRPTPISSRFPSANRSNHGPFKTRNKRSTYRTIGDSTGFRSVSRKVSVIDEARSIYAWKSFLLQSVSTVSIFQNKHHLSHTYSILKSWSLVKSLKQVPMNWCEIIEVTLSKLLGEITLKSLYQNC